MKQETIIKHVNEELAYLEEVVAFLHRLEDASLWLQVWEVHMYMWTTPRQ